MNKIKNELAMYNHKWIIFAKKRLSKQDQLNAVNNLISINEGGAFSFVLNKTVIFDIDEMKPLSEADYNSLGKED